MNSDVKIISVAEDFSRFPGGRYRRDGEYSGEQFRDDVLVPAISKHRRVIVLLDGVAGYPASFLEESFGGLVRSQKFLKAELREKLQIRADDPHYASYKILADKYIEQA